MTSNTLTRTANMLTVRLPVNPSQAELDAAMDWIAAHAIPGSDGTFLDLGDFHAWIFPAAA